MNNKVDVIDEPEESDTFSEASSAAEKQRCTSGLDIADSIDRAAFRRRADYNPAGIRHASKAAGSHH